MSAYVSMEGRSRLACVRIMIEADLLPDGFTEIFAAIALASMEQTALNHDRTAPASGFYAKESEPNWVSDAALQSVTGRGMLCSSPMCDVGSVLGAAQ